MGNEMFNRKMNYAASAIFVLFAACRFANALAGNEGASSIEVIREQQTALRSEIEAGTTFGLTPRQVNAVRKSQVLVFDLIEGRHDLSELSIEQKIRLENALEAINAQVRNDRQGEAEQQVCWRVRKTGSTTKVTRCGSQAERDFLRQNARDYLEKPKVCTPPGCG